MFTVKVGEAAPAGGDRPAAGPVYRSVYAKDGLMELPHDVQSPWDYFRFGFWHSVLCFHNVCVSQRFHQILLELWLEAHLRMVKSFQIMLFKISFFFWFL